MKKIFTAALMAAFLTTVSVNLNAQESLYKRLGGYDAIAAVVDDFIGKLATDKDLARFFKGASVNSQQRIRQHIVDMLCQASGGPCYYLGRDMKTVHTGLKISEKDWGTAANHLVATLDKFKVPQKEKDEVLALINSTKKDIVEQ